MTSPAPPPLVYAPAPCPRCGARTLDEAEPLCRPHRDETGEATCPAGDLEDEAGNFLQPTPASLQALDAWIDRHGRSVCGR